MRSNLIKNRGIATFVSLPRNDKFCYEPCTAKHNNLILRVITSKCSLRSNLIKKCAFTLAEVLITLGIIGVVAAITLSVLVQNYQKHATVNKLKTSYSILVNAFERAKSDYGLDINEWDIQGNNDKEKSNYFVENYLLPYLKVADDCSKSSCTLKYTYLNGATSNRSANARNFVITNGTMFSVLVGRISLNNPEDSIRAEIHIILNPGKKSLKVGRDVFAAELGGRNGIGGNFNKILPYAYLDSRGNTIPRV